METGVAHSLITDIAICIVVAWILAVVAQIFKQPLILAYLVAGLAIGPVGIGLIQDQGSIQTISQLGLLLLLFMIGLEIDLRKMLSTGRVIIIPATIQILGGCLLGVLFFWGLGFPLRSGSLDALYLAIAASLSSTVIIVKILYDKRELDTFAGRITVGILIMQDLFAILVLAFQPELKNPSLLILVKSLIKVAVLIAVALAASRFALPALFRSVARLPELVLVGALAWCFLVAGMAHGLGLSREMGALSAGVAISTFPYTLDVVAKVTSIRDFFVTLFFVALGMKIPEPTIHFVAWAFIFALFVICTRFLTVFAPLYAMRQGHRASLLPALNLSQVSELSLVILALGLAAGHLSEQSIGIVAYAFALLGVASAYAMTVSERFIRVAGDFLTRLGLPDLGAGNAEAVRNRQQQPRIFLLGFSWTASSLLEEISRRDPVMLSELAVIDFNPHVNRELGRRGVHTIYGDISQRDTLLHAGVADAEMIVCTLPNTVLKGVNNMRLLQQLREINSTAHIIIHAELLADVPRLYAAGASYVSLPRLIEAMDLFGVIHAARQQLIGEKTRELKHELEDRHEVIP